MPDRKARLASVVNASESFDDELEHITSDEMPLALDVARIGPAKVNRSLMYNYSLDDSSVTIPTTDTEKSTAFLVTNWLVGEGEG
jgi:hypothetical protein